MGRVVTGRTGGLSEIVKILLEHNVEIYASKGVIGNYYSYPASRPPALQIALSLNPFFFSKRRVLVAYKLPSLLQIAQWLVNSGAMVHGLIHKFSLDDILPGSGMPYSERVTNNR
jgi:hypothetical protein